MPAGTQAAFSGDRIRVRSGWTVADELQTAARCICRSRSWSGWRKFPTPSSSHKQPVWQHQDGARVVSCERGSLFCKVGACGPRLTGPRNPLAPGLVDEVDRWQVSAFPAQGRGARESRARAGATGRSAAGHPRPFGRDPAGCLRHPAPPGQRTSQFSIEVHAGAIDSRSRRTLA